MNYEKEIRLLAYKYEKENNRITDPYRSFIAGAKTIVEILDTHILSSQQISNDTKIYELQKIFKELKN